MTTGQLGRLVSARHLSTLVGAAIVGAIALIALAATLLAPHDPFTQHLTHRLAPPEWLPGGSPAHPFGTDQLGRDYLSRLIYGARITLGVLGGYFGGRVDDAVMFVITTRLAVPLILVALTVVALVGSSLTVVILVLSLLLWDRFAVVSRTATMQVRTLGYIAAARAAGCSHARILFSEVLPNIRNHLIVIATLEMALAILLSAALSFLGLGVPPPLPDWGLMIAEAESYMFFSPWVIMIPGTALFVLVIGINLLGDGLGDLLAVARTQ
jgi:peptide/nickel transport system permease protein